MAENLQLMLDDILKQEEGRRPRLLLHSCCGPCSSYVLEYLAPHFDITVDYYNPNIDTAAEYAHRAAEQARLVEAMGLSQQVEVRAFPYQPKAFFEAIRGLEDTGEGGRRCLACYRLRLAHAARLAKAEGFDYFTTTLSISPHKNAAWLADVGREMEAETGVRWLPSDFKKRGGFLRSTQLSRQYGMYRQDYCGCIFSKQEGEARAAKRAAQEAGEAGGRPKTPHRKPPPRQEPLCPQHGQTASRAPKGACGVFPGRV